MQPIEVAQALGVSSSTLRRWSDAFAPVLSQDAGQPEPGTTRTYTSDDLYILSKAQQLLQERYTTAQALARLRTQATERASTQAPKRIQHAADSLGDDEAGNADDDDSFDHEQTPGAQVIVLHERPEVEALRTLLDAQTRTLEAQEGTLKAQAGLIAQLQEDNAQVRQDAAQSREQLLDERARLQNELESTRADLVAQLVETRGRVERLPRWLRALLGLGV